MQYLQTTIILLSSSASNSSTRTPPPRTTCLAVCNSVYETNQPSHNLEQHSTMNFTIICRSIVNERIVVYQDYCPSPETETEPHRDRQQTRRRRELHPQAGLPSFHTSSTLPVFSAMCSPRYRQRRKSLSHYYCSCIE